MKIRNVVIHTLCVLLLITGVGLGTSAEASVYGGQNGIIQFSLVIGDTITSVVETGEPQNGVTPVTVQAWLTDVDPVTLDGLSFIRLGGFELNLVVDGGDYVLMPPQVEGHHVNLGRSSKECTVGFSLGAKIINGRALLATWVLMFQGHPENVAIGLDSANLKSCTNNESCTDCGPAAIYNGSVDSGHSKSLFGAGYIPAWINPVGQPDQTPVHSKCTWQDLGIFTAQD